MLAAYLGLMVAALFTGAAFYINFVEHPSRLTLDNQAMLDEWKNASGRGYFLHATLINLGFSFGILAWWFTGKVTHALGGILLLANWPWMMLVMLPTTDRLLKVQEADAQTRAMIVRWNKLHTSRTLIGALACLIFLIGISGPS
jgi:hypothetical protein